MSKIVKIRDQRIDVEKLLNDWEMRGLQIDALQSTIVELRRLLNETEAPVDMTMIGARLMCITGVESLINGRRGCQNCDQPNQEVCENLRRVLGRTVGTTWKV